MHFQELEGILIGLERPLEAFYIGISKDSSTGAVSGNFEAIPEGRGKARGRARRPMDSRIVRGPP